MRMAATAAVYNRLHNTSVGVVGGGIGPSGGVGAATGGHHHQLARSLERILEEAHLSGELILTNRKLKDFPKTGTKYNLSDTVIAESVKTTLQRFDTVPIYLIYIDPDPEGTHQYDLMKHAAATLGSGNLRNAVALPDGEDLNEWVANSEFRIMSAGPKYEYHWADGFTVKKPIKCSAPKYIDYLMTWVQDQLDDETLFPSKIGIPFPKNFLSNAKTILKRLFRVYAHIYHQHFSEVVTLGEEAPLQELIDKLTASAVKDERQI